MSEQQTKRLHINLLPHKLPKFQIMMSEKQLKLIRINILFPDNIKLKIKRFELREKRKHLESYHPEFSKNTLLGRFKDRTKAPGKWWFPVLPLKINRDENELKRQHEETSRTVRRALLVLTAFCLFCVLALSAGDVKLITTNASIKLPFANIEVDFKTFIITAPIMLTLLLVYLHIFYGHLRLIDKPDEGSQLPVLFNLPYRNAQLLSNFMLYWQVPLVLVFFYWKSIPQPGAAVPFFVMLFTMFFMVFLQIRRRSAEHRYRNRKLWFILIYLIFVFIDKSIVIVQGKPVSNSFLGENVKICRVKILHPLLTFPFNRKLQLAGANLSKTNLEDFNLSHADLRNANLSQARISGAFLERADLEGATMMDMVARGTHFTGADLSHANIDSANLEEAVFNSATLSEAILNNANLSRARISGAFLEKAKLRGAVMTSVVARGSQFTGADLSHTNIERSDLEGAVFNSANLYKANLNGANLRGALFINASLVEADICDAELDYAYFLKADLTNAKLDRSLQKNTTLKKKKSPAAAPNRTQKKSNGGK